MCPSLIQIGSKTAEKNSAQTNKQTDRQTNRHYENNGHLAVNQHCSVLLRFMMTERAIIFGRPYVKRFALCCRTVVLSGGLKTRDRKTRHGQNCRTGKRKTGKRGTKQQDWKTREKARMESQTAYSTCSSYFSVVLISVYSY